MEERASNSTFSKLNWLSFLFFLFREKWKHCVYFVLLPLECDQESFFSLNYILSFLALFLSLFLHGILDEKESESDQEQEEEVILQIDRVP